MARVTVSSSSITVAGGIAVAQRVILKNKTGTAAVYLELDGAASASTSYEWAVADGPITLELAPGVTVKGLSAGVDQTIHVLGTPD